MVFYPKLSLIALVMLFSLSFADCAKNAYLDTCMNCPFDEYGKVDKACADRYQSSGTACVSSSYPIMSAKYAAGGCPAVDVCAAELQSCTAQSSSGNDKEDCGHGKVIDCYVAADNCVSRAAALCGAPVPPGIDCHLIPLAALLVLAGSLFISRK